MDDRLAEAARAVLRLVMGPPLGMDWHPAVAALLAELNAHDERVIGEAVEMVRAGQIE